MWRNDVKDFMNNKLVEFNYEELELTLEIKGMDETIKCKLDKPYLIFGITFLLVPNDYKYLSGKYMIHPITKEDIPIFISDIKSCHLGIPAHNDRDYEFALRNNIPIKQVVMPVNASLDNNRPRDDKEWSYKQNVVLVVKHWREEKYLYIEYKKQDWKCFISGGIEVNEDAKMAALRELTEESGFHNIKEIKELPFKMANVFYAAHKDINRYTTVTSFYIELKDGSSLEMAQKEKDEHEIKWGTKEELYKILANGFTDQIWLLKQVLGEINSYYGRGKIINSDFLNDIEDFKIASDKVKEYLKKNNY